MKSRSRSTICFAFFLITILAACSSDDKTPEPTPNQSFLQATIDTLQATVDASDSSDAVIEPTIAVLASTASISEATSIPDMPTRDSNEDDNASLDKLIVGSWVDTSPDVTDILNFLPNGSFFLDASVGTALASAISYEVKDDRTIMMTDHRIAQDNTYLGIVVGEITSDTMASPQNNWSESETTYKKLMGVENLPDEIVGLWRVEEKQADFPIELMIFNPDGSLLMGLSSYLQDEEITYQILSNSVIALQTPAWDAPAPIWVDTVSDNIGIFKFDTSEPSVSFERLRENAQLRDRLVGVWEGGAVEFTSDGHLIDHESDRVSPFQIYDDGTFIIMDDGFVTVRQIRFRSDDEFDLCFPERSETGLPIWDCSEGTVSR